MGIRFLKGWVMLVLLLLIAVGCSTNNGAVTEKVAPLDEDGYNFPDYVYEATFPGALEAYRYVVDVKDEGILEYIPCYCNCYIEPFHHENIKDCFINNEHTTKDLLVYDPHGAGWGVCIEIALDVQELREEGKPMIEIRDFIDETYSIFAEPTPTPYPPEGL